jgi:hypothetical protein
MLDPASTSAAFAMPIWLWVSLAVGVVSSAANTPKDSAESTIAAAAVFDFFHNVFFSFYI